MISSSPMQRRFQRTMSQPSTNRKPLCRVNIMEHALEEHSPKPTPWAMDTFPHRTTAAALKTPLQFLAALSLSALMKPVTCLGSPPREGMNQEVAVTPISPAPGSTANREIRRAPGRAMRLRYRVMHRAGVIVRGRADSNDDGSCRWFPVMPVITVPPNSIPATTGLINNRLIPGVFYRAPGRESRFTVLSRPIVDDFDNNQLVTPSELVHVKADRPKYRAHPYTGYWFSRYLRYSQPPRHG